MPKNTICKIQFPLGEELHCSPALRGGSWYNNDNNLRCAARNYNNPDNWNNNIGFRVVRMSPSLPNHAHFPLVFGPDAVALRSNGLVFGHDIRHAALLPAVGSVIHGVNPKIKIL